MADLMPKMQQAQALHRGGRLDDARKLCEELLREVPGRFEALSLLALIAAQQGYFARGWAEYEWRWKTPHGRALREHKGHRAADIAERHFGGHVMHAAAMRPPPPNAYAHQHGQRTGSRQPTIAAPLAWLRTHDVAGAAPELLADFTQVFMNSRRASPRCSF